MDTNFNRVSLLPTYVFSELNALKGKYRAEGQDIIDFGMGNPDQNPPDFVVEKLKEVASRKRTHGYSASIGIKGLRKAQADYYMRRFDVALDPDTEIISTIGSKEGFANLAMAITSPGDVFLVPDPAYPIHPYGFIIAGGSVLRVQSCHDGKFDPEIYLRELDSAVRNSFIKPKAIVVNFPSNPTAQTCTLEFYKDLVAFARRHQIWVISDIAYSEIYYNDTPPISILQVEGAKDVAIEFSSLSKTFSMAGWRVGFAVGSPVLISALAKIKSYLDYGAFTPIQVAATTALNSDFSYVDTLRKNYKKRRDTLVSGLEKAGWPVRSPDATMFVWAKIPEQYQHLNSVDFSKLLLKDAGVAVAPGSGFGSAGEGYVRISLVENQNRIRQAVRQISTIFDAP